MAEMKLHASVVRRFRAIIWEHFRAYRRRFPWREIHDPYAILVSEVMLQQTQVDRVVPFFNRWMEEFPTVKALARAPHRKTLRMWQGLGYNRRVLFLKDSAEMIVREHGGVVPRDLGKLDALPGVGRNTASAVLAFAWNEPATFIETNVRTVYLHFFFQNRKKVRDEEILELVTQTLPNTEPPPHRHSHILKKVRMSSREWYAALMDYGAMLKATVGNQNVRSAHYVKQKEFNGSRRELRGKIIRHLAKGEKGTAREIARILNADRKDIPDALADLASEGFLRKEGRGFKLA